MWSPSGEELGVVVALGAETRLELDVVDGRVDVEAEDVIAIRLVVNDSVRVLSDEDAVERAHSCLGLIELSRFATHPDASEVDDGMASPSDGDTIPAPGPVVDDAEDMEVVDNCEVVCVCENNGDDGTLLPEFAPFRLGIGMRDIDVRLLIDVVNVEEKDSRNGVAVMSSVVTDETVVMLVVEVVVVEVDSGGLLLLELEELDVEVEVEVEVEPEVEVDVDVDADDEVDADVDADVEVDAEVDVDVELVLSFLLSSVHFGSDAIPCILSRCPIASPLW